MREADCLKCDNPIRVSAGATETICSCGAKYIVSNRYLDLDNVTYELDFSGFICINNRSYMNKCYNACPTAHMFCEDCVSDKHIDDKNRDIQTAQKRLEEHKHILDRILESKKVWLMRKLSGLSEEDDTLPEDPDG